MAVDVVRSSTHRSKPLAVALLGIRPHTTVARWRAGRAQLTERAKDEGYRLLEVFDITGDPAIDEAMYVAVQTLVDRTGAATLLVHDVADLTPVHLLADRLGARVVCAIEEHGPVIGVARVPTPTSPAGTTGH